MHHPPCLSWGTLTMHANTTNNQLLLKTRSILTAKTLKSDLTPEANLFGALWHYRVLKSRMKQTLLWGFSGGKARPEGLAGSVVSGSHPVIMMSQELT